MASRASLQVTGSTSDASCFSSREPQIGGALFGNSAPPVDPFTRADVAAWRARFARLLALRDELDGLEPTAARERQLVTLRRWLREAVELRDEVQRRQPETRAW